MITLDKRIGKECSRQKSLSYICKMRLFMILLCLVMMAPSFAQLQTKAVSNISKITNYYSKDFKANPQIFDIVQDKDGFMYFANQTGIFRYDGTEYVKIEPRDPDKGSTEVRALEMDDAGRIYVGGYSTFGYLYDDETGKVKYKSLEHLAPKGITDFGFVKSISFRADKVYFQSGEYIFIYNGKTIEHIKCPTQFSSLSQEDGVIYARVMDLGLYYIDMQDSLRLFQNGTYYADKNLYSLLNFSGKLLAVTNSKGLIHIDKDRNNNILDILQGETFNNAIRLGQEFLSVGTFDNGIRILDKNLNLVEKATVDDGLLDGNIQAQYVDKEGNLWLATNRGVAKVEVNAIVKEYSKLLGINASIEDITKFRGNMYISTYFGLKYLNQNGEIKKVKDISNDCYGINIVEVNGDSILLISEVSAVRKLDSDSTSSDVFKAAPYMVVSSKKNDNYFFVADYEGLYCIKYENGRFIPVDDIQNFSKVVYNALTLPNGEIWMGTEQSGVYVLHEDYFIKNDTTKKLKHLGQAEGLSSGPSYLGLINGEIHVGTDQGLKKWNGNTFELTDDFGFTFSGKDKASRTGVHRFKQAPNGSVWMILFDQQNNYEIGYAENKKGKYTWYSKDFVNYDEEIIHAIYHDNDGSTWLGGTSNLLRFDPSIKKDYKSPFQTHITNITFGPKIKFYSAKKANNSPEISYQNNNVSFTFSSTSFYDEAETEYSYKLEGVDANWSPWSKTRMKEYTLSEGTYTFRVKARNVYGYESEEATITFTILPPWYRTGWAYTLFLVLFIGIVWIAIVLSVRRVKRQNQRLEATIKERTAEVVSQKEEIEHQKEILEEKNQDIMDSIKYAKHIQDAILPEEEELKEEFSDAFILFRPKDIVSGDFYWMSKKENQVLVSAVDCTGHGVPGAFVSIVGNNGLNRAVNEFQLKKPGEILDKLTLLVEEAFKQKSSSDVKDGMDLALISYNKEENTIQYAGANNPLYLIREGQLTEIKANKQPIGAFDNRKPFTNHEIKVQKGDRVILFSDGYADQFGGARGKKLKYKAFKNILLENLDQPIASYKDILNSYLINWMGDLEQIDDVCIIGLEI
jgi:serine phosphatase RsbU (regulator of sigma subunit)/ligand-binding sensor domain-containing protein